MPGTLSGRSEPHPGQTGAKTLILLQGAGRVRFTGRMGMLKRMRTVAGGGLVLVAALGLAAGCGDDTDAASDSTDKTATVQTAAPSPTASSELPDGFPADDVPLLDETIVNVVDGGANGQFAWSVVMRSTRAVDDLSDEVRKDFAGAGYQTDQSSDLADVAVMKFTSAEYVVGVTVARTSDKVSITYLVKNAG